MRGDSLSHRLSIGAWKKNAKCGQRNIRMVGCFACTRWVIISIEYVQFLERVLVANPALCPHEVTGIACADCKACWTSPIMIGFNLH
jgi:hypothetical protein